MGFPKVEWGGESELQLLTKGFSVKKPIDMGQLVVRGGGLGVWA